LVGKKGTCPLWAAAREGGRFILRASFKGKKRRPLLSSHRGKKGGMKVVPLLGMRGRDHLA